MAAEIQIIAYGYPHSASSAAVRPVRPCWLDTSMAKADSSGNARPWPTPPPRTLPPPSVNILLTYMRSW